MLCCINSECMFKFSLILAFILQLLAVVISSIDSQYQCSKIETCYATCCVAYGTCIGSEAETCIAKCYDSYIAKSENNVNFNQTKISDDFRLIAECTKDYECSEQHVVKQFCCKGKGYDENKAGECCNFFSYFYNNDFFISTPPTTYCNLGFGNLFLKKLLIRFLMDGLIYFFAYFVGCFFYCLYLTSKLLAYIIAKMLRKLKKIYYKRKESGANELEIKIID